MKKAIGIIKPPFQKIRGVVKPDGQKWLPFSAAHPHNPGGGALVFQAGYHPCKRTFKTFCRYENRP